jgi:hypothetical protein
MASKKVRPKKCVRKSASEKVRPKKCVRKSAYEKVRPKKSYFSSAREYIKLPFSLRVPKKTNITYSTFKI